MKRKKKKMNKREFEMFVSAARVYAAFDENLREDGSIILDFVSADLFSNNGIGEFRGEDSEAVLCAAQQQVENEEVYEEERNKCGEVEQEERIRDLEEALVRADRHAEDLEERIQYLEQQCEEMETDLYDDEDV